MTSSQITESHEKKKSVSSGHKTLEFISKQLSKFFEKYFIFVYDIYHFLSLSLITLSNNSRASLNKYYNIK